MIIIDQFTRRIMGFAMHKGDVNGPAVCRMFNEIISGRSLSKGISSDNNPLFTYHQWQANLRILDIEEIKSVPYSPTSHPFIERAIQAIRIELLDQILFCTADDLQNKLYNYQKLFNTNRSHKSLKAKTPAQKSGINNNIIGLKLHLRTKCSLRSNNYIKI